MYLNEHFIETDLWNFLQIHPLINYVRLQWIDYSGILRTCFLPVDQCLKIAERDENFPIAQASMIVPVSTAPRSIPTGKYLETWVLRPDWTSLRVCGFRPSHASVMCFVGHKEARSIDRCCPQQLLCNSVRDYERNYYAQLLAGFEIEVMLLGQDGDPLKDLDRLNSYQTSAGLRGQKLDMVEEIIENLKLSSVHIQHFHTASHDQIQFSLSPESLLNAVDSLIIAQETIRTVFIRYNIRATMAPRPVFDGPTNGIYLHLSFDGITLPPADRFLGGILDHMEALCALGMANVDGYVRTVNNAAGVWIGYGTENRDLPVRKINDQHWEFRMLDSTANPYLFVAAVLMTGMNGIKRIDDVAWKDCHALPDLLTEEELMGYSLIKKMPKSFEEALESLKGDKELKELIPQDLLDFYIDVKVKEVEFFQKMGHYNERRNRFLEYF